MGVGSCLLSNPLARMSQVSAVHQLHMNCDLRVSGFREIVCCERPKIRNRAMRSDEIALRTFSIGTKIQFVIH